jgi:hypothetical protein
MKPQPGTILIHNGTLGGCSGAPSSPAAAGFVAD